MKIKDILAGFKKRKDRNSRSSRITQHSGLHNIDIKKLKEGARIQHLEDLILGLDGPKGYAGGKKAISALHQIESNPSTITIKWDGSPAVIFGRDEKGEFILTDKSGFGAKGYDGKVKSADGLEGMLKNRPGYEKNPQGYGDFIGKMKAIWSKVESNVPADFRGYVHGDLLWFTTPQLDKGRLTFKPNTTLYSVDAQSDIGKKIADSDVGIVIHMAIDLDGNKNNVDMSRFQSGSTMIMPPVTMTQSPGVDIPAVDDLEKFLNKHSKSIDDLLNVPEELKMKNFGDILYTYINNSVKTGNLSNLGDNFMDWIGSAKLSDPKKQRLGQWVTDNKDGFNALFGFINSIKLIKNQVINTLDSQKADIEASTGGQRGGEGYVIDKDVKLVNRAGFTAANMAQQR
jgi:hypothetical protein